MTCYDHLGNEFKSKTDRAIHYGIHPNVVQYRLSQGWNLKDALTQSKHEAHVNGAPNSKRITDPDGTEYRSIAAMCAAYGISHSLYAHRIARGWSQKKALSPAKRRSY